MINNKLSIAIILPTIISKNGTVKQSKELARVFLERGHRVNFFTFAYSSKNSFPEFNKYSIKYCIDVEKSFIHKFIKNPSILEKIYLYYSMIFIKKFRGLFEKEDIDILNPHDWFGLWVAKGLSNINIPIVANINDVPDRTGGSFLNSLKLNVDRRNINKINSLIVLDNLNKKKIIMWIDIDIKKIFVVRSGVDTEKFHQFSKKINIRKLLKIPNDSILLVCANLLAKNRRYEDVIYALKKMKNKSIHLIILSKLDFDKKYGKFLQSIVSEERLDHRVHFIDKFFSDRERMTYIKNSDILIFPNSPQTWGLTVLEAMALGVPCIVSSGAGVSEVLHDNTDALVYEKRSVDEIIEKILVLINNDKLYKKISENGKIYVLKNFSWDNYATNVERIMMAELNKKNNS